jgi:hypothetical protein
MKAIGCRPRPIFGCGVKEYEENRLAATPREFRFTIEAVNERTVEAGAFSGAASGRLPSAIERRD